MAVRIQFRRGTAAEWTAANPTLAAGELGYESDTGSFKIGNGSSNWAALSYGAVSESYVNDAVANVVGLSPETLNTLEELAASIGNNANFVQTVTDMVADAEANAYSYTDNAVAGLVSTAPQTLDTLAELSAALNNDQNFYVTLQNSINGVNAYAVAYTDGEILQLQNVVETMLTAYVTNQDFQTDLGTHVQDTTDVHGISNTANLAYTSDISNAVTAHNTTTNVHGISDTANLAYLQDIINAISEHNNDTTGIHGISDTSALATNDSVTQVAGDLSIHISDTTNVHGIADTADLVTVNNIGTAVAPTLAAYATLEDPSFTGDVVLPATTSIGPVSGTEIGYLNNVSSNIQDQLDAKLATASAASIYAPIANASLTGNVSLPSTTTIGNVSAEEISYLNNVSSAIQTQLDAKAPIDSPTFTGTVSGITKSMVGLGNVDNTSDLDKPISNAVQTALDAKAALSGATFTGAVTVEGDLTVTGNTVTVGTQDLVVSDPMIYLGEGNSGNAVDLGFVANYNNGTYQHTGLVRDASTNKWRLFTGVVAEPTTVVDFANATSDSLELGTLEVDTQITFADGTTQTTAGVPSLTQFSTKTSSFTLDSIAAKDSVYEVNSSSAVTVTIPANADLAWPIGASVDILQVGTGQVTISPAAGVTLNYTPGNKLRTQWSSCTILKRGTNSWVVYGDLTA